MEGPSPWSIAILLFIAVNILLVIRARRRIQSVKLEAPDPLTTDQSHLQGPVISSKSPVSSSKHNIGRSGQGQQSVANFNTHFYSNLTMGLIVIFPCALMVLFHVRLVMAIHNHYRSLEYPLLQVQSSPSLQEVFQVYQPPSRPQDTGSCDQEILLMDHVFESSYGKPFVGDYTPPNCTFDTVHINLTVTSRGKQFDRLALLYLGDIEVFRTSTAEPTSAGIVWTYIKEMSQYNSLWKKSQKIIFDLGNIVNDVYTASFNTTLTAHFSYQGAGIRVADRVLPISAAKSKSGAASAFNFPADNTSVSYKIPSTVSRAVVAISACGQSQEEFWWSNVFSSDTDSFATTVGELYGYSPFRETQLYIDGLLAGVVWPFPVIFTGGVAPGFWRPIVGIDAFDLRSSEIDISPFLPMIRDGNLHSFEIRVCGLDVLSDGSAVLTDTVGSYWVVTGNIFLYEDEAGDSDEGEYYDEESAGSDENASDASIQIITPEPNFQISRKLSQNATGRNDTLEYSVLAERTVEIKSWKYSWTQTLSFLNYGFLNQQGYSQSNKQLTTGNSTIKDLTNSSGLPSSSNETSFKYPLLVNSTYGITPDTLKIDAWMKRGLEIHSSGDFALSSYTFSESSPSRLITSMSGKAKYKSGPGGGSAGSVSKGTTVAEFEGLLNGRSYARSVRAVNGDVVYDTYPQPRPRLRSGETEVQGSDTGTGTGGGRDSVRSMLGRGPGKLKMETRGSEREL